MAKDFTRWVTHKVIPAIFRTGSYSVQQESSVPAVCEEPEELEPKLKYLSRSRERTAIKILDAVFYAKGEELDEADVKKVLALDKIFETTTGISLLETIGVKLRKEITQKTRSITLPNSGEPFYYSEYKTRYNWEDSLIEDYFGEH